MMLNYLPYYGFTNSGVVLRKITSEVLTVVFESFMPTLYTSISFTL